MLAHLEHFFERVLYIAFHFPFFLVFNGFHDIVPAPLITINIIARTFNLVNGTDLKGITGSFTNCSYPYFLLLNVHDASPVDLYTSDLTWSLR